MLNLGLISAVPTFFTKDNKIDHHAIITLIETQVKAGIKSILIGGSTGELMLMTKDEYIDLLSIIYKNFHTKLNIIASNSFDFMLPYHDLIDKILEIGIEYTLCVVPPYIKANQSCIVNYFKFVADKIKTIIYSVPSRTGADISFESFCELSHHDNIIGFKDSSANIARVTKIKEYLISHKLEKKLELFSGDDMSYLAFCAQGGSGAISVVANIVPRLMQEIQNDIIQNNFKKAQEIFFSIIKIIQALELDTNPIAVKYILSLINIENQSSKLLPNCRFPLSIVEQKLIDYCKNNNLIALINELNK